MKFNNFSKVVIILCAAVVAVVAFACTKPATNTVANAPANGSTAPVPDKKPPTLTDVPVGGAKSPTEAYRMLFAAVKSQDPAKIRLMLSKATLGGLAEMAAGTQKKTVDEVIANGFSETTFSDTYPQMRDERVKGVMGAVEVYNEKRKLFEDLPFILEDGSWKLAVGDAFSKKWDSPGKGQSQIEQENANANNPNALIPAGPNGAGNFNSGKRLKTK